MNLNKWEIKFSCRIKRSVDLKRGFYRFNYSIDLLSFGLVNSVVIELLGIKVPPYNKVNIF